MEAYSVLHVKLDIVFVLKKCSRFYKTIYDTEESIYAGQRGRGDFISHGKVARSVNYH